MKGYPSIPRSTGTTFVEFDAYVFDKLDGSQVRVEWSRKAGWHKFGTRHRLFDASDPDFGPSMLTFALELAEPIEAIIRAQRWDRAIIFTELTGPSSFAGVHDRAEAKTLTLFDVAPHQRGLLPPKEFLKLFDGHVRTPAFLGQMRWTRGLVERVRNGQIDGITFEGVVGKAPGKQGPIMAKAKTQAWLDRVAALYSPEEARRIIES